MTLWFPFNPTANKLSSGEKATARTPYVVLVSTSCGLGLKLFPCLE